jgi:predicted transcriptional regulator
MLNPLRIKVLGLIAQNLVYSEKKGGSMTYTRYSDIVHKLALEGYCMIFPENSMRCRKDYILTQKGEAALADWSQ